MGFVFNPLLWFVCRSCRQAFADTDKLKKHKLENHLSDCLRIKCIIFEERHVDQELISIKDEIFGNINPISDCNTLINENPPDTEVRTRTQSTKLPNPHVLIKKLATHEVSQAFNANFENKGPSAKARRSRKSTRCTYKTQSLASLLAIDADELGLPKQKKLNTEPAHNADEFLLLLEHEKNPTLLELESPVTAVPALSPEPPFDGYVSDANLTSQNPSDQELQDREFIVASIVKDPDGTEKIQFQSALIPTSAEEFERLKQDKFYPTILDSDTGANVSITIDKDILATNERSEATSIFKPSKNIPEIIPSNTKQSLDAGIKFEKNTVDLTNSVADNNFLPNTNTEELFIDTEADDLMTDCSAAASVMDDDSIDYDGDHTVQIKTDITQIDISDSEPIALIDGSSTTQCQVIPSPNKSVPKSPLPILNVNTNNVSNLNISSAITTENNSVHYNDITPNEAESRSRYNTRKRKKVNYSETQSCKGCNKDFYVVEDLEDHEKICLRRRSSISIKKPSTKVNFGETSILRTETEKTKHSDYLNMDQDIQVIQTASASSSIEAQSKLVDLEINDDDDYVCPVSDDSDSIIDIDDEEDDYEVGNVMRRKIRKPRVRNSESSKSKGKNAEYISIAATATISYPEDPEYYEDNHLISPTESYPEDHLSFIEWLNLQKERIASGKSTNIILLENDPTILSSSSFTDSKIQNLIVCKLCHLKLNFPSEKKIRNHIENCWFHNKLKHRYCVECDFGFENVILLKRHKKYDHVEEQLTAVPTKRSEENDEPNEDDEDSDESDFEYDLNALPLGPWLKKRIENLEQRHKQNKSKLELIVLDPDPAVKNYENIVVNRKTPLTCRLCGLKIEMEVQVRKHVLNCWRLNKLVHEYCIPCKQPFSNTGQLNWHNYCQHTPGPKFPFFCNICCKGFLDEEIYKQHVNSRHTFKCYMNTQVYGGNTGDNKSSNDIEINNSQKSDFGQWLKDQKEKNPANIILLTPDPTSEDFGPISNSNSVQCVLCLRVFTSEKVVKSHVSMCWFHNKRIHRYCAKCNKSKFKSSKDLKEHNYKWHSKVTRVKFKCKECGKEFKSPRMFKFHEKTHKMPEEVLKPFKCEICGAHFQYITNLNLHLVSHKEDRPAKCPHCPATWKCERALARHLITHGKKTGYVCTFCSRVFIAKHLLRDHERTHTGDKPYKCTVENCDYAFPSKPSLTMHTRIKHGKELGLTQYLCPTCGKVFGLQSHLNYHIRRFHTEAADKPFKCPEEGCSRTFSMKEQLISHGRMHTGEKPYQCDKCGNSFAQAQTFRKHQKKHEENSNEVLCDLCPKKFPGMSELRRHLKRHENSAVEEKKKSTRKRGNNMNRFTCDLCGLECSTKLSLKKHEKTHEDNLSDDESDGESMGSKTTESD